MPTYDYKCQTCQALFEVRQAWNDDNLIVCIMCGDTEVQKVFSAAPVHFKGKGFYATDK